MKLDKAVLGILLLALAPVAVQMLVGYGGHDFRQHVASWMELRDLWHAGQFHPGWAPRAAFTLGDARFLYYPPVPFTVGTGLAMLLPFAAVPAAYVWLTFALSGLAMYFACRDFVAVEDRWKAAVMYMASPYLLTTSLVRFAAAEVLTLVWLPLILLYFYRAVWLRSRRSTIFGFCGVGATAVRPPEAPGAPAVAGAPGIPCVSGRLAMGITHQRTSSSWLAGRIGTTRSSSGSSSNGIGSRIPAGGGGGSQDSIGSTNE